MPESYVGFIDAGYLRAEGARALGTRATAVRPDASAVADWFVDQPSSELIDQTFLRMVRLASRSVFQTAVVVAGDRDLAEVVRTVQDYGVRVLIATPNRSSVASEILQLADDMIDISEEALRTMLTDRPS